MAIVVGESLAIVVVGPTSYRDYPRGTIELPRTHRGQRPIFTMTANSGSLQKFDNSCTARIFSLHDFQEGSHENGRMFVDFYSLIVTLTTRVRVQFAKKCQAGSPRACSACTKID